MPHFACVSAVKASTHRPDSNQWQIVFIRPLCYLSSDPFGRKVALNSPSRKTRLCSRIIQCIISQCKSLHVYVGAAFFQIRHTFATYIADFRAKYAGLAWFHNPCIFVAKKLHISSESPQNSEKYCVYFTQDQPFSPVAMGTLWSDIIMRREHHRKAANPAMKPWWSLHQSHLPTKKSY